MDDLSEQLARRDRVRRFLAMKKTPEQRMADMSKMQQAMWDRMRSSPEGYAHFLRRNFKARAIDVRPTDG